MKAVEDLDFVPAHEKDAAVAAILILASRRIRRRPLDMQLAVAEFIPGRDVAGPRGDGELAGLHVPPGGTAAGGLPA